MHLFLVVGVGGEEPAIWPGSELRLLLIVVLRESKSKKGEDNKRDEINLPGILKMCGFSLPYCWKILLYLYGVFQYVGCTSLV